MFVVSGNRFSGSNIRSRTRSKSTNDCDVKLPNHRLLESISECDDGNSDSTAPLSMSSSSISSGDDIDINTSTEVDEEATESLCLFKPTFYSPMDRLETATNPATPRWLALDALCNLREWVIEAADEEIDLYIDEIKTTAIPELFQYLRTNVDDNQCVCEALELLRRFACHKDICAIVFVEAHAINILVLALLAHNTNGFSPNQQHTCLFRTIWNFLIDITLCPSVFVYFKNCDDKNKQGEQEQQPKYYQRMKLVAAVDLCLDRAGHAMSFSWMAQIFDILQMLLRSDCDDGNIKPNGEVRLAIWEKKIAQKCQQMLDTTINEDYSDLFEYERVHVGAISFFRSCLIDRDDALSESLDRHDLAKFVRKSLAEFPMVGYIQGIGCQILQEIASESFPSSSNDNNNSSSGRSSRTILIGDLTAKADEICPCTGNLSSNSSFSSSSSSSSNSNNTSSKPEEKKNDSSSSNNNNKYYLATLITSIFTKPCCEGGDDQIFEDLWYSMSSMN